MKTGLRQSFQSPLGAHSMDASGALTRSRTRVAFLAGTALAGLLLSAGTMLAPTPAGAVNECGVVAAGGTATCTSAGNVYPNGITYDVTDLTVVVDNDVVVNAVGFDGINMGGGAFGTQTLNIASGAGVTSDQTAIYVQSTNGDVTIDSGAEIMAGATGIDALLPANGTLSVTSDGTIQSTNRAINAYLQGVGDLTVVSTGNLNSTAGAGVYARHTNSGNTSVSSTGDVYAGGGSALRAIGSGNTLTINSVGDLTSATSGGIIGQQNGNGDIVITSQGNVSAVNFAAIGGYLTLLNGSVSINSLGDLTSTNSYGIRSGLSNGGISITSEGAINSDNVGIRARVGSTGGITINSTGPITSANADGIEALLGSNGSVNVSSVGDITALNGNAIYASHDNVGGLTVASTGNLQAGMFGIYAYAAPGGSTGINVTSIGNIVATQEGISVRQRDTGSMVISSTGTVTTTNYHGVYGIQTMDGSVSITSLGDINHGNGRGIFGRSYGSGTIDISSVGNIMSAGGSSVGIQASSTGDRDITISSQGDIAVARTGIAASLTFFTGNTEITSVGNITTTGGFGIRTTTDTGNSTISSQGTINAHYAGIDAAVGQNGDIHVTSVGPITSAIRQAIRASVGNTGNVTVNSTGNLQSDLHGIETYALAGTIDVTSMGNIQAGDDAIYAIAPFGNVIVHSEGDLTASSNGIRTGSIGTVQVTSIGNIAAGPGGQGIGASSDSTITINSTGNIGSGQDGIRANTLLGDVFITSSGNVSSAFASGIRAETNYSITIDSNGAVTGNDDAIRAYTQFNGNIIITSVGAITSIAQNGIDARVNNNGNVTVTSVGDLTSNTASAIVANTNFGQVTVNSTGNLAGASNGIDVGNFNGAINVTSVGDIDVGTDAIRVNTTSVVMVNSTGNLVAGSRGIGVTALNQPTMVSSVGNIQSAGPGIQVAAALGDVTLDVAGSVVSTATDGINISTGGAIVINNSAVVTGTANGIILNNFGDPVAINNTGSIGLQSAVIPSINFLGNSTTQTDNTGNINGFVLLGGGIDIVNNQAGGTFHAQGVSNFGASNDRFINRGIFRVFDTGGADAVTLNSLERFDNSGGGQILMNDGGAGDALTTSGNFTAGGTLQLDVLVDNAAPLADVLNVGGAVNNIIGPTTIIPTVVAVNSSPLPAGGVTVVTTNGTAAGDFQLAGFFDFTLNQVGNDWVLNGTGGLNSEAQQFASLITAQQNLWHGTINNFAHRLNGLRSVVNGTSPLNAVSVTPAAADGRLGAANNSLWLRAVGGVADYNASNAVDYEQDMVGLQAGYDIVFDLGQGAGYMVAGVAGGYLESDVDYKSSSMAATFSGAFVAGYLSYFAGGFYADALVKADFLDLDLTAPAIPAADKTDAESIGFAFDTGYRFDLNDGFYITPQAHVSYVETDIGSMTFPVGTVLFRDGESLRVGGGVQAGVRSVLSDGTVMEPYITARIMHDFEGQNTVALSGFPTTDNASDTWGEAGGGVQFGSPGLLTGFLDAKVQFGSDVFGVTAKGGLRVFF